MANKVGAVLASVGALTDIDTTARNPLMTVVQDENGGEYIYLTGVASTGAGSWVTFDELGITTLLTADAVGPVAVAMAATVASTYGWYCIVSPKSGVTGKTDTIADNKSCYIDGTAGRVDDAGVAGDLVFRAWSRSTDSSNLATFQIDHPFVCDGAYLV